MILDLQTGYLLAGACYIVANVLGIIISGELDKRPFGRHRAKNKIN